MIDQRTLAYINLYGVLGTLENLCELAPEAESILTNKKPISIGFEIKGGPSATITFYKGKCRMEQGCTKCDVKLPFSSPGEPSFPLFTEILIALYIPFSSKPKYKTRYM